MLDRPGGYWLDNDAWQGMHKQHITDSYLGTWSKDSEGNPTTACRLQIDGKWIQGKITVFPNS